jgi:hypothetical protein
LGWRRCNADEVKSWINEAICSPKNKDKYVLRRIDGKYNNIEN